jgi:hypothetical protein
VRRRTQRAAEQFDAVLVACVVELFDHRRWVQEHIDVRRRALKKAEREAKGR